MKKPLIIIILGKQGSGKGTQVELLRKKFQLGFISSGDLLRARKRKKDFTGRKTARVVDSGGLILTPVIFNLWLDKFEELKKKPDLKGFVMEGSPRKILEAHLLDESLEWFEWDKDVKVILLDISYKEAIQRLTKRRICDDCKKILPFIGEFKRMKKCPKCGGKLVKREDDNIAAIKNRLSWFKTDVQPVINHYRKVGKLITINGEQGIEAVAKDILKAIK